MVRDFGEDSSGIFYFIRWSRLIFLSRRTLLKDRQSLSGKLRPPLTQLDARWRGLLGETGCRSPLLWIYTIKQRRSSVFRIKLHYRRVDSRSRRQPCRMRPRCNPARERPACSAFRLSMIGGIHIELPSNLPYGMIHGGYKNCLCLLRPGESSRRMITIPVLKSIQSTS